MKIFLSLILLINLLTADYFIEYIKYDENKSLGKIVITKELLRGRFSVDTFEDNQKYFENNNMFSTHAKFDDSKEIIKKSIINNHNIETKINIQYPRSKGVHAAIPIVKINLWYDQKHYIKDIFMDCVGVVNDDNAKYIDKIEIHPYDDIIYTYYRSCSDDSLVVFTKYDDEMIEMKNNNPLVIEK